MEKIDVTVWCNDFSIPGKELIKLLQRKGWTYKLMLTMDTPCVIVDGVHISGYERIFSLLS